MKLPWIPIRNKNPQDGENVLINLHGEIFFLAMYMKPYRKHKDKYENKWIYSKAYFIPYGAEELYSKISAERVSHWLPKEYFIVKNNTKLFKIKETNFDKELKKMKQKLGIK